MTWWHISTKWPTHQPPDITVNTHDWLSQSRRMTESVNTMILNTFLTKRNNSLVPSN